MIESKPQYSTFKKTVNGKKERFYSIKWVNLNNRWQQRKTKYSKKSDAEKEAYRLAVEAHEIRVGKRNSPLPQDHKKYENLSIHIEDYVLWGNSHGGKNNKGWDTEHCRKIKSQLIWWLNKTGWKKINQVNIRKAERVLQQKKKEVRIFRRSGKLIEREITGKTVDHYKNTLKSFINWYRKYYQIKGDHPLEGLTAWDTSVTDKRRDLTIKEVAKLIKTAPLERSIIYWLAVITGLRREEINDLSDDNYSYQKAEILIDSDHNKERQEDVVIVLPKMLNQRIYEYIKNRGNHNNLFKFDFNRASHFFDIDCRAAEIPKYTLDGKLVFHSLRDTQVNLGIDLGADVKTGMSASRHKTTEIYMQKYAKKKKGKVLDLMNQMEQSIMDEIDINEK